MKGLLIFCISLLVISTGCSPGPEETGRKFLLALQQRDFEKAASLSTNDTAAIVLFIQEMLIANDETREYLDLPLPVAEPEYLSTADAEGYVILEFIAGNQNFVLHGIETKGRWKIRLPRSSW